MAAAERLGYRVNLPPAANAAARSPFNPQMSVAVKPSADATPAREHDDAPHEGHLPRAPYRAGQVG